MNNRKTLKNDRAEQIALAAFHHFASQGYQSASLEQIAATAGIGKSTVYEYYNSKEELFVSAVQVAGGGWFEELSAILSQTQDPMERLALFARAVVDPGPRKACDTQRLFYEILTQTALENGVFYARKDVIRTIYRQLIRMVSDVLLEGVSQGRLHPSIAKDVEKIATVFLAFLHGLKLTAMISADSLDIDSYLNYFMRHLDPLLCPSNPDEMQAADYQTSA